MKIIAFVVLALSISTVHAIELKIGYIDVDKVINNLSQYKKDNESLVREFDPKKIELIELFDYLELLKNQYRNESESLSSDLNQKNINDIQNLEIRLQKETDLWQQQINTKQQLLLQKIELKVNNAVKQLAINENYVLILYQNAAFVDDSINITNAIISIIETTY